MATTMSQEQIMFFLSITSNAGSDITGSGIGAKVNAEIQKKLDILNTQSDSNWSIVWGAGLFQNNPGGVLDNAMYAAFNPDYMGKPTYFISVAGTNASSTFDWLTEDLDTSTVVQWPYSKTKANISKGISIGLSKLVAMQPEKGLPGASQTLNTFLSKNLSQYDEYTLITGGHSLGGALSPLVALWLKDTQSTWDKDSKVTDFQSWPSAGQTPGLENFTTYYNSQIPKTQRIFNSLDVVPHAFNKDTLEAAKTLYAPEINSDTVDLLIDLRLYQIDPLVYTQIATTDYKLTGVLNKKIIDHLPLFDAVNYFKQMIYQHVEAYFKLLDVDYDTERINKDATIALNNLIAYAKKHAKDFS